MVHLIRLLVASREIIWRLLSFVKHSMFASRGLAGLSWGDTWWSLGDSMQVLRHEWDWGRGCSKVHTQTGLAWTQTSKNTSRGQGSCKVRETAHGLQKAAAGTGQGKAEISIDMASWVLESGMSHWDGGWVLCGNEKPLKGDCANNPGVITWCLQEGHNCWQSSLCHLQGLRLSTYFLPYVECLTSDHGLNTLQSFKLQCHEPVAAVISFSLK